MNRFRLLLLMILFCGTLSAQLPDVTYQPAIRSIKLYRSGDVYSYPVMSLGSADGLELHFDDLDGGFKNLYYTYQLCNADWSVSTLPGFDYIQGFQSTRISNYRNSSISLVPYTHYQASIPDRGSTLKRSGNYLLRVFRNNDTSDIFFTKRFLVIDNRVAVAAQIRQPFSSQLFLTDQRVEVSLNTTNARINSLSPQDLKVVVLQNNSWNTAALIDRPSIFRGDYYEYNDDRLSFPSGREWRWLDLRSLRLLSDRLTRIVDTANRTEVFVKPEAERRSLIYMYYKDLNGMYTIENTDGNNPMFQSDYTYTHFTYAPPGGQPYGGKDLYVYGELTNWSLDNNSRMTWDPESRVYQGTLLLKQGYYNYLYVSADGNGRDKGIYNVGNTEGNFTNTENVYTVLVYYRGFGGRSDELLGYATVSSFIGR